VTENEFMAKILCGANVFLLRLSLDLISRRRLMPTFWHQGQSMKFP